MNETYTWKMIREDSDRAIDSYRDKLFIRFDTEYQKEFGTFVSCVLAAASVLPLAASFS